MAFLIRSHEIHVITNMIKLMSSLLIIRCHITMNNVQKAKNLWMIGTILVILFVSLYSTINYSILHISKALAATGVENNENEETAYIKFAAQTIKESNNTSSTLQIPEAAKGPPIPAA
jgi:hypothetical protein